MLTLAHEYKVYCLKPNRNIPYRSIECAIIYQVRHCTEEKKPIQVEVLGYTKDDKFRTKPKKLYSPNLNLTLVEDLYQERWELLDKHFKDNYPISTYSANAVIQEDDRLHSIKNYTTCFLNFKKRIN